jgi:hypothetical protein
MIRRYEIAKMTGYAGACHRAAFRADPVGFNPSYALREMLYDNSIR